MSGTRAENAARGNVKDAGEPTTRLTTYAIYKPASTTVNDDPLSWISVGSIGAHGAQDAIRRWANSQGEAFAGGPVMAVPSRSVTVAVVKVETRRQLTLGAP